MKTNKETKTKPCIFCGAEWDTNTRLANGQYICGLCRACKDDDMWNLLETLYNNIYTKGYKVGFENGKKCAMAVNELVQGWSVEEVEKREVPIFTKNELFMLELAVNDIYNNGNNAYEGISKKISKLLKE